MEAFLYSPGIVKLWESPQQSWGFTGDYYTGEAEYFPGRDHCDTSYLKAVMRRRRYCKITLTVSIEYPGILASSKPGLIVIPSGGQRWVDNTLDWNCHSRCLTYQEPSLQNNEWHCRPGS